MTEEQVRLLGFQAALEKEEGGRPGMVGLSLNETIRQCFIKGNVKKAEKLRGDWKVPDKRYWRCAGVRSHMHALPALTRLRPQHSDISADRHAGLGRPMDVCRVQEEPGRLHGLCVAPRRCGPDEGGAALRTEVRERQGRPCAAQVSTSALRDETRSLMPCDPCHSALIHRLPAAQSQPLAEKLEEVVG